MLPDLSASIARMDRDDLSDLADILPGALWRAPAGTERRDWADTLMGQVIAAQEAHERAATGYRGATRSR
ncbi:hypothetical protein ACFCZ4_05740 [Streptomyces microflavus]|uniref:hypothetical protein n=1 Tax=Streptomyces microflavus TaxID=1919 RepID=UPI0035D5C553